MDGDRRRTWEDRHRREPAIGDPSPFVVRALARLGPVAGRPDACGRALDLACGRGRHALLLAERGYRVDAVDFARPALAMLQATVRARGLAVRCLAADVAAWPLPRARYGLVVVVDFLDRRLFPALREAVAPGGALLYETHCQDPAGATGPGLRRDFLLAAGELDRLCDGWSILLRHDATGRHHDRPARRSGILARRPAH